MTTIDLTSKLEGLRALIADYSYSERRRAGMLAEIDALLSWALREVVPSGAGSHEVEALLGPPFGTVGEKSDPSFRWLYPGACSAEEAEQASEWFFTLTFKKGKLDSVERRGWSN